jgi:hypothetical protein
MVIEGGIAMTKQVLTLQKEFFEDSEYAKKIIEQQDSDDFGLIFDDFVHDIGAYLEIDVIYESLNEDETKWLIGEDEHIKVFLEEQDDTFIFIFQPLTSHGEKLLQDLNLKFFDRFIKSDGN